jgi:hypothetical protein
MALCFTYEKWADWIRIETAYSSIPGDSFSAK